jgi:hypothetical protein
MKKTVFLLMACMLVLSCVTKKGRIDIVSDPPGATVYMDNVKVGVTPMTYDYNFETSRVMKLEMDGYHPYEEIMNWGWVHWETAKGNVSKDVEINVGDKKEKVWTVTIHRKLYEKPERKEKSEQRISP